MKNFIQKIASRKFQIAAVMVIGGLIAMFTESGGDQATATAQKIIGGLMAVLSAMGYIAGEAKVDAARLMSANQASAGSAD